MPCPGVVGVKCTFNSCTDSDIRSCLRVQQQDRGTCTCQVFGVEGCVLYFMRNKKKNSLLEKLQRDFSHPAIPECHQITTGARKGKPRPLIW